jgi:hypothetical protein
MKIFLSHLDEMVRRATLAQDMKRDIDPTLLEPMVNALVQNIQQTRPTQPIDFYNAEQEIFDTYCMYSWVADIQKLIHLVFGDYPEQQDVIIDMPNKHSRGEIAAECSISKQLKGEVQILRNNTSVKQQQH